MNTTTAAEPENTGTALGPDIESPTNSPEMEPDSTVYRTLLESTRAIPWKIDWATMRFTYIGPQIEALLGWTPESWVSIDDWVERMHPDDRDSVVNFCVTQSKSGVDHEADYRALTREGHYIWIRDVVHVVRKDDEVEALVGFMFDISERKQQEEELLRIKSELETLSYSDSLTAIANRRQFDLVLEREWAHARRDQRPLAVIMLDIDHFKEYNDRYGHPAGDVCLQRIAACLAGAVSRQQDLLARLGGEEFVLVLPDTDIDAAHALAQRCLQQIRDEAIAHTSSRIASTLTASAGVASMIPDDSDSDTQLVEAADRALYQAKRSGRDRVTIAAADNPPPAT
ncbi:MULTISPECIES: sensor domain-containing diguanylate cyclase [unclassified Thioalkalivibrio]|uniref:sensor domain-containing diguanylate cyclase n=1 Tax=unclassified Thioalkalivibrio TaxID=2621013 RepID=UPI000377A8B1|nr:MULTISPECIES: sensor domain-containing diguanylate cyclase [unclassified Thioalkalivibrio]